MTRKQWLLLGVIALVWGTVVACGTENPTTSSNSNSDTPFGVKVFVQHVPDGRDITCIGSDRGLSCDWSTK